MISTRFAQGRLLGEVAESSSDSLFSLLRFRVSSPLLVALLVAARSGGAVADKVVLQKSDETQQLLTCLLTHVASRSRGAKKLAIRFVILSTGFSDGQIDMASPLLVTKLHLPFPRSPLMQRNHLLAKLNQGLTGRLILLSAAAGFGKTTVLSEWAQHAQLPVSWLALDERDNDPTRFWTYLVAALQGTERAIGEATAILP